MSAAKTPVTDKSERMAQLEAQWITLLRLDAVAYSYVLLDVYAEARRDVLMEYRELTAQAAQ